MVLSLVLLSFTRNIRVNAELERAYLDRVKEGYDLRGACLIAFRKLPVKTGTSEGSRPVPGAEVREPTQQRGPVGGVAEEGVTEEVTEEEDDEFEEFLEEEEEEDEEEDDEEEGEDEEERDEEEIWKDYWKPSLEPYTLKFKEREYFVFIEDENGKLNINALVEGKKDVFKRLLKARGIGQHEAEVVTESLIDWLDTDDTTNPMGAESKYYEAIPEPYPCRNGPLSSLEEFALIKGVSPEIYEKVEKDLTIYGQELKINVNTASREVIHAALGISLQEADEMVAFVNEKKGIKNLDELKDLFFKFGVAGKDFEAIRSLMTTSFSPYITIRSKGMTERQYRLVVSREDGNILAVYPE